MAHMLVQLTGPRQDWHPAGKADVMTSIGELYLKLNLKIMGMQGLPPLTGPNKAYLDRLKAMHEHLAAADGSALRLGILRGEA